MHWCTKGLALQCLSLLLLMQAEDQKQEYQLEGPKLEVFREDIPRVQFQCQQTKNCLLPMHAHNYYTD